MKHEPPGDEAMPDGRRCPSCGAPFDRVHRHVVDRWISLFTSVHRYRCVDPACGWEGVLGRDRVGASDEMRWPAAETLLDGWRRSPGHQRNLVEPKVERMGLAATARYVTFFACR